MCLTPPYISYPRVADSNFRQAHHVSEKLEFATCSAPPIENVIEDFDETNMMGALLRSKMENARTGIRNMLNKVPTPLRSLHHCSMICKIKFIKCNQYRCEKHTNYLGKL